MIAVVAHDAGGAEILSSYLRRSGTEAVFVLDGPARAIFERKLGRVRVCSLDEALAGASAVLTGTSWESRLELDVIRMARARGLRSTTFLDHWVNFPRRFQRDGASVLPDELWVGDVEAERLALDVFPGIPVRVVENPYLLDLRDELERLPPRAERGPGQGLAALFISEPIASYCEAEFGDRRHWGYVEQDALDYLSKYLGRIDPRIGRIVVRQHPSEPAGKYASYTADGSGRFVAGGGRSLLEDIRDADVVVGCESMALVVALAAGKRVVCAIPPGGKPSSLPHRGIESLQQLVAGAPHLSSTSRGHHAGTAP